MQRATALTQQCCQRNARDAEPREGAGQLGHRSAFAAFNCLTISLERRKTSALMSRRLRSISWCRVLPAVLLAFSGITAIAQQQAIQSQDRAQLLRNQAPALRDETNGEESEGVAPASPNDADLGEQAILKRADEYLPWSVSFGAPV